MQNLTGKNELLLRFIINFKKQSGYSPSISEIRDGTKNKSVRGISLQLKKLQKLGYIYRNPQIRRSIKVLIDINSYAPEEKIKIPLVGDVAAGALSFAEENIENYYEIPISSTHGRKDAFLLKVRGESMLKAGYKPGEIVIVVPQHEPNSGDVVVAYDEEKNGATLKRFKKMQDYMLLMPESDDPKYKPIIGRQFIIQGKVIGKLNFND